MPIAQVGDIALFWERTAADEPSAPSPDAAPRPTLVLLNGLFQRVERWDPVMPFLEGYDVLRYDMRGQGRSSAPPGAYTPEAHRDDLVGLLDALGVRRYVAVGLSNGGVVAQCLAATSPPGLRGVVLTCTTARLDAGLRAKLGSWRDALDAGGVALRLQVSLPWALGATYLESHPELLAPSTLEASIRGAPTLEAHRSLLDGLLSLGDLRPSLEGVAVPALVIAGEEDLLFPPSYGREIALRMPRAQLVVAPRLGHTLPLEDPQTFATTVRRFVDERIVS